MPRHPPNALSRLNALQKTVDDQSDRSDRTDRSDLEFWNALGFSMSCLLIYLAADDRDVHSAAMCGATLWRRCILDYSVFKEQKGCSASKSLVFFDSVTW